MAETAVIAEGQPCTVCQIWLPCELLDALARRAQELGLSDSQLVAEALHAYLAVPEPSAEEGQCPK